MTPVAGGGETEKEVSAWTVDSMRDSIADTHVLRDRIDDWRDRLYVERANHIREIGELREAQRREVLDLREQMAAQRFAATEQALAIAQQANAEKFAGFPEQYALKGDTDIKIQSLEKTLSDLVAASQVRTGAETGASAQRGEVAAQAEQRRLSQGTRLALAAVALTVLNTLLAWLLSRG